MAAPVADELVLQAVAASVRETFRNQHGEAAEPGGTVTVDLTRADGTVIAAGRVTTDEGTTYAVALTAAELATLDLISAAWKVDGVARSSTLVEVVGGYPFSIAEWKAIEASLLSSVSNTEAALRTARRDASDEAERICRVAFTPRYRRETVSGDGSTRLFLEWARPRSVRSVRIHTSATSFTTLTASELAEVTLDHHGWLDRRAATWPCGVANIVVEYEHGYDSPPGRVAEMMMRRARYLLNMPKSGMNDRQPRIVIEEGRTFVLNSVGPFRTGDDDVDAEYDRWSYSPSGVA